MTGDQKKKLKNKIKENKKQYEWSLLYLGDKNACDDGQLVQGAQSSS